MAEPIHHNGRIYEPGDVLEIDPGSKMEKLAAEVLVTLGRVTPIEAAPGKKKGGN
ncbi:MAG: hypothetical protein HQL79_07510 [Magnetococcales bacterium]|nr:hypothetical protein [Magnetococcales bacterium]